MSRTSFSLSFVFALLLLQPIFSQDSKTVRITNGDWPPYLSETLPHNGIASQLVTEAFAEVGIKVQYGFFPWARSLQLAQEGDWDGSAVWLKSAEREQDFYFSDAVVTADYVFFHLKKFPFKWNKVSDLKGIRIGGTLSYNYGDEFQTAEKEGLINVQRAPSDELGFNRLFGDRIDIFPMDHIVGNYMLATLHTPEEVALITFDSKPLKRDSLYLLLSKKVEANKKLIILFNQGLKKLRENGRYEQIVKLLKSSL